MRLRIRENVCGLCRFPFQISNFQFESLPLELPRKERETALPSAAPQGRRGDNRGGWLTNATKNKNRLRVRCKPATYGERLLRFNGGREILRFAPFAQSAQGKQNDGREWVTFSLR